jgi:hypothetical protein
LRLEAQSPNVLPMDSKLRAGTRRVSAIVVGLTLVAALVGACSTGSTTAGQTTAGTAGHTADCRSFGGETVQAVAWSSGGNFLAVSSSSDADGQGRIRVYGWPEMNLVSQAQTDALAVQDAAIDDVGAVYWFTWDPMADEASARQLWTLAGGGSATTVGEPAAAGPYVGLVWAGGSLITMEADMGPPERSRLVKIDVAHPEADPVAVSAWTTRLWSTFWADRSGAWLVWDEYDEAGAPQDFVIQHDGKRQVVRPPGYGGLQMTLSPDRTALIYQRSETARLTVLNLKSGQITGELSPLDFYGGEVSSAGILAGLTAHGPGESNKLCTVDVSGQLAPS